MKTLAIAILLLFSCAARPAAICATYTQPALASTAVQHAEGNAVEGRQLFTKLRCEICHAVAGSSVRAPHPLPDLTAQPPEAVAAMIVQRQEIRHGAFFDEIAMASAASQVTPKQMTHLVAYLRESR
jgi:mono/diheme cytochrome c family protein